jgi:hypothetical protein
MEISELWYTSGVSVTAIGDYTPNAVSINDLAYRL